MATTEPRNLIDVLQRLEDWRQDKPDQTRRSFRRFPIRGEGRIEPVHESCFEQAPLKVMLRDLSRGGVGFVSERPLDVGSVWRMAFIRHDRQIGTQTFVVRFRRPIHEGLYLVGGIFTIEPHLMVMMGIDEIHLTDDIEERSGPEDTTAFLPPEQIED